MKDIKDIKSNWRIQYQHILHICLVHECIHIYIFSHSELEKEQNKKLFNLLRRSFSLQRPRIYMTKQKYIKKLAWKGCTILFSFMLHWKTFLVLVFMLTSCHLFSYQFLSPQIHFQSHKSYFFFSSDLELSSFQEPGFACVIFRTCNWLLTAQCNFLSKSNVSLCSH